MRVDLTKKFIKRLKIIPTKIRAAFRDRYELFINNPFNPILNNHALTGEYAGRRSIDVTGDWRVIFSEYQGDKEKIIVFELINTHSELYK